MKEGLALINGTDGILGMLCLALTDRHLLRTANICAAMSVEGQLGTDDVFAADLQALRPCQGRPVGMIWRHAVITASGSTAIGACKGADAIPALPARFVMLATSLRTMMSITTDGDLNSPPVRQSVIRFRPA
ncbi:MAG: aromatic amino acid lyase [Nocardioidaceae bacterium]